MDKNIIKELLQEKERGIEREELRTIKRYMKVAQSLSNVTTVSLFKKYFL